MCDKASGFDGVCGLDFHLDNEAHQHVQAKMEPQALVAD